jgi:hypothetical protein
MLSSKGIFWSIYNYKWFMLKFYSSLRTV